MEKNWGNKKRVLPRPLYEYKDVPFLDEEAAEVAYLHAVDLANNLFFMEGKLLVNKFGNIVRVPEWFPFGI
jgi:hypothetical protein